MGNKLGKKRQVVDEKYTKPQGLYPIKDVDFKKLRKLILESKLAPCYPGGDDGDSGLLEECPICFLHYPTLNRSRCCTKSICTECFLQMKNPNSTRPTQCPFCKASNYAVEYRGGKSKEERGLEQIEEQKVIEAKIRKQQQDFQEEEERMHRRQETSSSSGVTHTENIEGTTSRVVEGEAIVSSQDLIATPVPRQQQHQWPNREDDFDWDLEDIMVMEAIWLSVQDNVAQPAEQPPYRSSSQLPPPSLPPPPPPPPLLSSGGLVSTIAALAERQQMGGDPFTRNNYYNNRCISSHPPQPLSPTSLSMPARLGSADVSSLADCQHLGGEPSSSSNYYNNSSRNQNITLADNMLASSSSSKASSQPKKSNWSHFFNPLSNSVEYQHNRMAVSSNDCGEWVTNGDGTINTNRLGVGEAGTSFPRRSSDESEPEGEFMLPPPPPPLLPRGSFECSCSDESDGEDEFKYLQLPPPPPPPPFLPATSSQQQQFAGGGTGEGFHGGMAGPIVPESFEEQMMFAMAVSLAEARARTSAAQGVAWQ